MQYGLLKYDEWNDLLWLYNSIDSPIRTSLTGSLIGIKREDESIQYTHFLNNDRNPYTIADEYNQYCGCFDNSINSLGVYEEYLLVGKSKDLFVVSKDGERMLNVLTSYAQYDVTQGGTGHICCSVFPCTLNSSKILLSGNSNELYFVDSYTGQVSSKIFAFIESSGPDYCNDRISVISDFMSNQSNSSCTQSYYFERPNYQTPYYDNNTHDFGYFYYNQHESVTGNEGNNNTNNNNTNNDYGNTTNNDTNNKENNSPRFSFESVAEKYGSVKSIPEFVPSGCPGSNVKTNLSTSSYQTNSAAEVYRTTSRGNLLTNYSAQSYGQVNRSSSGYSERTIGSMSLECILKELKSPRTLHNDFVDTTCVGMSSGFMHIVDNRANKIVSSVNCNNNPVYSISASGNTIATTSCTLYSYSNVYQNQYGNPYSNSYNTMMLFEPVVYLHDIRMMKTTSFILEKPVSKLFIVPKSDRMFALSQEGDLFDCKISTLEYTKYQNASTGGGSYYDLEVSGDLKGDKLEVFTSDSTYSVKRSEFSNSLSQYLDFNLNKLPRKLREIPRSESKNYNSTPFASLVGTFEGDVAHIFVQMFFFLPKLPSIKYHVCEISHCITCQIGFGLNNLDVYYQNHSDLDRFEANNNNNNTNNTNNDDSNTTNNDTNNKENNNNNNSKSNKNTKSTHFNKYSNKIIYMTQLQELMLIEKEPSVRTPLNLLLWLIEKLNTEMHNYYNKNNYKVTTSLMKDLFSYSKKTETRCSKHNHVNTMVTHNNFYMNYENLVEFNSSSTASSQEYLNSGSSNNLDNEENNNTNNNNNNNNNNDTNTNNNNNNNTDDTNNKDENNNNNENTNNENNTNRVEKEDEKYVMEYCKDCNSTLECKLSVEYLNTPNILIVDYTSTKVDCVEKSLVFCGNKYNLSSFYFTFPLYKLNYRSLAYIKIPKKYKTDEHEWILVNDGIVMYIDEIEDEIFDFTKNWKIPIFAIYVKQCTNKKKTVQPNNRHRKGSKKGNLSGRGGNDEMTTVDLDGVLEIVPCVNEKENITSVKGRLVPLPYPSLRNPIPSHIFLSEHNIAHNPLAHNKIKTFTPITVDELNAIHNSNFLFSLDIEYIKSNLTNTCTFHNTQTQTQTDTRASAPNMSSFIVSEDDDKYLYTLARVTAIRGNDTMYGVPFLDHYILNNKPPKDYMTRFSGIRYGDLELKSSVHWLTTEKLIYLKLRYLIDSGCKVIGHGLEQDFKILNISVPSENVIDTLELFWIPGKRYLSLQFLAHYLLNQRIQQNEHDSIEDAKTALQLFKLYINYKLNNKLKSVIEKLYEIGYQTNWTLK